MKAIIETGGKQYVVSPGDKINIEKIIAESDKEHIIKKVLSQDQVTLALVICLFKVRDFSP